MDTRCLVVVYYRCYGFLFSLFSSLPLLSISLLLLLLLFLDYYASSPGRFSPHLDFLAPTGLDGRVDLSLRFFAASGRRRGDHCSFSHYFSFSLSLSPSLSLSHTSSPPTLPSAIPHLTPYFAFLLSSLFLLPFTPANIVPPLLPVWVSCPRVSQDIQPLPGLFDVPVPG